MSDFANNMLTKSDAEFILNVQIFPKILRHAFTAKVHRKMVEQSLRAFIVAKRHFTSFIIKVYGC